MSTGPGSPNPSDADDLKNPMFIAWLADQLQDDTLEPDAQDFEKPLTPAITSKEYAGLYRLALSRKLVRMYAVWKASQN
jgi:hypothetical protein